MATDVVLFEKRGYARNVISTASTSHLAIFTLNRPAAMNAISHEVSESMEKLIDKFEADDDLWLGIICSSHPKVFCAGADLKSISEGKQVSTKRNGFAGFVNAKREKPIIAVVDGAALAGGFEICLACDMIVASKASRFGVPEVKRSLVAAAGGLYRLPKKIPQNIAMEMLYTGDPISAERAYALGLVNRLAEPGKSMEVALKLADEILVNAPLAVRVSRIVAIKSSQTLDEAQLEKLSGDGIMSLAQTDDYKEGPKAFIEKRAPKWTGKRGNAKLAKL